MPNEIPAVEQLIADHKEFMENTARRQPEVDRACKPKTPPAGTKEPSARKPSRQLKTPVYVQQNCPFSSYSFPHLQCSVHELLDVYLFHLDFKTLTHLFYLFAYMQLCTFAAHFPKFDHFGSPPNSQNSPFPIFILLYTPFVCCICVVPPKIPKPHHNFLFLFSNVHII